MSESHPAGLQGPLENSYAADLPLGYGAAFAAAPPNPEFMPEYAYPEHAYAPVQQPGFDAGAPMSDPHSPAPQDPAAGHGYAPAEPEFATAAQYGTAHFAAPEPAAPAPAFAPAAAFAPAPVFDAEPAAPVFDAEPAPRPGGRAERRRARSGRAPAARPVRADRPADTRRAALRVALPSVAAVGVAAVAAVAVAEPGGHQDSAPEAISAPDAAAHVSAAAADAPKTALDDRLDDLQHQVDGFAGRASRAQTRLTLQQRAAELKKKRKQAAAEREARRPKFVLPIRQHTGLSAGFGQSGTHWMSLHTGIDFPVQVGTEVHAATDGTVESQWGGAYGNMVKLTAADGTQTWYCHLSSAKIRSGKVKAGDVIAYSGDTGNSTGPHMHFEVHPHGGPAVDPVPWLLAHKLDPR